MTRGILLPFVLTGAVLAQTASPVSPTLTAKAPTVNLSDTEKIALQAVLEERKQLGAKLQAIDSDVRRAHPGFHLEWGMDSVTLVKDVEVAKPEPAKK